MRRPTLKQAPNGEIYTSESVLQQACLRWFRTVSSIYAMFLFSIPNGGKYGGKTNSRGVSIQAAIMVGEGLTKGVADLFLALANSGLHGLFIEMKTPVGYWDKDQQEFAKRQIAQGYGYAICKNQNEFEKITTLYMNGKYQQKTFEQLKKWKS